MHGFDNLETELLDDHAKYLKELSFIYNGVGDDTFFRITHCISSSGTGFTVPKIFEFYLFADRDQLDHIKYIFMPEASFITDDDTMPVKFILLTEVITSLALMPAASRKPLASTFATITPLGVVCFNSALKLLAFF